MKTQRLNIGFIFLLGLVLALPAQAQIDLPPLSPEVFVKQKVGFTSVEITYSRPSMRGRVIFGEVVPFNEVWRTGANVSTKISFNQDVTLENHKVPAGTYALYTIPGKEEWTIILNSNLDPGSNFSYVVSDDFLRFQVKPLQSTYHFETFTIDVGELTQTSATLQLMWENTIVRINLSTKSNQVALARIDERLKDPTIQGNDYYSAAHYYVSTHHDMDMALIWINKAIEIDGATPWYLHLKGKIMVEQGHYRRAVKIALEARDLAKDSGDDGLIRLSDKLIDKWREMAAIN